MLAFLPSSDEVVVSSALQIQFGAGDFMSRHRALDPGPPGLTVGGLLSTDIANCSGALNSI